MERQNIEFSSLRSVLTPKKSIGDRVWLMSMVIVVQIVFTLAKWLAEF